MPLSAFKHETCVSLLTFSLTTAVSPRSSDHPVVTFLTSAEDSDSDELDTEALLPDHSLGSNRLVQPRGGSNSSGMRSAATHKPNAATTAATNTTLATPVERMQSRSAPSSFDLGIEGEPPAGPPTVSVTLVSDEEEDRNVVAGRCHHALCAMSAPVLHHQSRSLLALVSSCLGQFERPSV